MARLGWKKDRFDHRDYLYAAKRRGALPDYINLQADIPDVRDQGNLGSCVGFGVGGQLTFLAKTHGVYTEWFSPTWIYNGARFIEGSLGEDTGCYPKDALDWLLKKGCLLEHFWPYKDVLDKQAPPSKFDVEAAKWPEYSYYRIDNGVDGIKAALADGKVVSIGTPWYNKWMTPSADGRLADVNYFSGIAGGHETFLYGYDTPQKLFYGQNSWGPSWGNAGRYMMPFGAFDTMKYQGGYDAHTIEVRWSATPPTPPEPEPEPEPTPDPTPGPDMDELKRRVDALELRIKAAEDRISRHLQT